MVFNTIVLCQGALLIFTPDFFLTKFFSFPGIFRALEPFGLVNGAAELPQRTKRTETNGIIVAAKNQKN